jgi:hypothetical protein
MDGAIVRIKNYFAARPQRVTKKTEPYVSTATLQGRWYRQGGMAREAFPFTQCQPGPAATPAFFFCAAKMPLD